MPRYAPRRYPKAWSWMILRGPGSIVRGEIVLLEAPSREFWPIFQNVTPETVRSDWGHAVRLLVRPKNL